MTDLEKLRQAFGEAIAPLGNYRRRDAWEYVKALEAQIAKKDAEISQLAEQVMRLEA